MFGAFTMVFFIGREDKEVIHVNGKPFFSDHVMERVIHEVLEGSGRVGKTKEHDGGFKEAFVGSKGSFLLMTIFDADIVVPPADVKLGEEFSVFELVNEVGDEREGIGVPDDVSV